MPSKSWPLDSQTPGPTAVTNRVMPGSTVMRSPLGSHCRTLVDPCPTHATPMGTRYFSYSASAEGGNETAVLAVILHARLRVVRRPPIVAAERGHHSRL